MLHEQQLSVANCWQSTRELAFLVVLDDKADSGIIAEYAMRNYDQMRLYKPLGRNLERLREVFLYRHNLVKLKVCITLRKGEKQLTQEKSDISRFMTMSSKHLISEFNKKIAECDKRIQQIIDEDEELQRNFEIITSVPGVGAQNAVCLMVYTDNFSRFDYDSRKIACYYGVAPFGRQSGTSVNTPAHVSPFANKLDQGPADTGCARIRQLLSADGYILPQASRGRKEETCCCQ